MKLQDIFKKKSSGQAAKDRLKLVLVSDRSSCSPEIMERIKNDILDVLSKYAEVDQEGLDIKFTQMEAEGAEATKYYTMTMFCTERKYPCTDSS